MRLILPCAVILLLGGCALPIPVQVAVWALDGISLASTQKTMADHGVSALAQRDCSFWRGIVDGDGMCRDDNVLVAEGGDPASDTVPRSSDDDAPVSEGQTGAETPKEPTPEELAEFETAAGEPHRDAVGLKSVERTSKEAAQIPLVAASAETPNGARPAGEGAIYYVIGSFSEAVQATAAADRYRSLSASVVDTRLDGRTFYRVTVGPFDEGDVRGMHARLRNAGINDAWLWRANTRSRSGFPPQAQPSADFILPGS